MEISVFLRQKSAVEISVILIIDLPKYHFLHQTENNPSFDYFYVLVSDILWLKLFQNRNGPQIFLLRIKFSINAP